MKVVKVKKKWICGQREYESPEDSLKWRKSICVHVDSNDPGKRETLITERGKKDVGPSAHKVLAFGESRSSSV